MRIPEPVPGLVIRYSYLWRHDHARGRDEGSKDRPCAVLLSVTGHDARTRVVVVLPITHTAPDDPSLSVEIPLSTKRRLGLDTERSWIVLTESNRFVWPGPDLRPVGRGVAASVAYGELPGALFEIVREKWLALYRIRKTRVTPRSE